MNAEDTRLSPCDLLFTKGSGPLSKLIRWSTRAKNEPATETNHVGLIVSDGFLPYSIVVEALLRVAVHSVGSAYRDGSTKLLVARPMNMTGVQRAKVCAAAESRLGERYGFGKIGLHLIDGLLGKATGRNIIFARRLISDRSEHPICSYLVASAFSEAANLRFGIIGRAATPDDMLDFVRTNPDKYGVVVEWSTLEV